VILPPLVFPDWSHAQILLLASKISLSLLLLLDGARSPPKYIIMSSTNLKFDQLRHYPYNEIPASCDNEIDLHSQRKHQSLAMS